MVIIAVIPCNADWKKQPSFLSCQHITQPKWWESEAHRDIPFICQVLLARLCCDGECLWSHWLQETTIVKQWCKFWQWAGQWPWRAWKSCHMHWGVQTQPTHGAICAGQICGTWVCLTQLWSRLLTCTAIRFDWNCFMLAIVGAPQDRSRVFFIAALRGLPMPKIPRPGHAYPYKQFDKKLATYEYLEHLARPGNCMPFPEVRLRDAIGDLVCISGYLYLLSTFITA